MRRFLLLGVVLTTAITLVSAGIAACGGSDAIDDGADGAVDAAPRRDAPVVEAPDASSTDAPTSPPASCAKYCEQVQETCVGANAQYVSTEECMAFCSVLPLGQEGDDGANTVGCRQRYADSPARTDAVTYCLAAGPFGGGYCEDRCTVFCQLTLEVCSPDAGGTPGYVPYPSYAECRSACTAFSFKDGGIDGGGEGLDGPTSGDTLNCRLHLLRGVVMNGEGCTELGVDSPTCKDD